MEKGRVWKSIKPTFDLHTCTHMHAYALAHAHSHTNGCTHKCVHKQVHAHITCVLMYTHEYMRVYEQTTVVNSSELIPACCLFV